MQRRSFIAAILSSPPHLPGICDSKAWAPQTLNTEMKASCRCAFGLLGLLLLSTLLPNAASARCGCTAPLGTWARLMMLPDPGWAGMTPGPGWSWLQLARLAQR